MALADVRPLFTPATASAAGKESARRRPRANLRQLLNLQDALYELAMDEKVSPKDRASNACAWEKLENRKRILLGRPDPGSLKPEPASKSKRRLPSVLPEPVPE